MRYMVRVEKKRLNFSSSHFVVEGGRCESLHGHNYHTSVELEGELDDTGYVVDFVRLKRMLQEIIFPLDHKILVASKNPSLKIGENEGEIEISFGKKRYVFPREECILLPLSNCTVEHLAAYLLSLLKKRLIEEGCRNISRIRMGVEESEGQWGIVENAFKP